MKILRELLGFIVLLPAVTSGQGNQARYALPSVPQEPPKPLVPAGLENYFRLNNPGSNWLKALGLNGFIPERNFDFENNEEEEQEQNQANQNEILRRLAGGAAPPQIPAGLQLPPSLRNLPGLEGLNFGGRSGLGTAKQTDPGHTFQGSAAVSAQNAAANAAAARRAAALAQALSAASNRNNGPSSGIPNVRRANINTQGSSISGIPNIFPTLPKAPVPQPRIASRYSRIPKPPTSPGVPNGGGFEQVSLGGLPPELLSQVQPGQTGLGLRSSGSAPSTFVPGSGLAVGGAGQQPPPAPNPAASLASLIPKTVPSPNSGQNLLTQLAQLLGISPSSGASAPVGSGPAQPAGPAGLPRGLDLSTLNGLLGLGPKNQGVLSSVLYNALTDGAVQQAQTDNDTSASSLAKFADATNLRKNVALVQQLITQPESPLCNPKPVPVRSFNVDAFMGTWYQTLYSPPLSQGPCSMVAYKKLADVAAGGPGTVFDTFEYTTEGTPFGQPKISSGYAIIRGPGQLIYRTTSSPTDVNVNVLKTGPLNENAQYQYVVLAVNCNYPLHVFARNPVEYKQKYEAEVNSFLEQRGITNGFSRLLNIVAPVDSSLCHFPPTLFNIQG